MILERRAALLAAMALAGALAGCSKSPPPAKVDAKQEQAEALERARHDAFGAQVQALDKAKALEADINKKASENVDRIEKDAK
jgi:hypothetical protein